MDALPNCILIGAMKCGTTSLHNYLGLHPRIYTSKIKEVNFFIEEQNWNNGINWYKSLFDENFKIRIESSQNYSKRHIFKGVPERMKSVLGENLKIIYITRDPFERIKSHFAERLTGGIAESKTLAESLRPFYEKGLLKENHYVQTSDYFYQLKPYIKIFGLNNIHVVKIEELRSNPIKTLNQIFAFLEIEELADEIDFKKKYNQSRLKYYNPRFFIKLFKLSKYIPGFRKMLIMSSKMKIFQRKLEPQHTAIPEDIKVSLNKIFLNY